MASPVTQPATLHAIRQDNMAVHILRLSLFSRLVNNFLYASHFCHENAMGKKNEFNPPWASWLQKAMNSQLDFIHNVKRHHTKYFWCKEREIKNTGRFNTFSSINTKPFKNGNNNKKTPLLREVLPVCCKLNLQESDLSLKKNNSCHRFSNFVICAAILLLFSSINWNIELTFVT